MRQVQEQESDDHYDWRSDCTHLKCMGNLCFT